MDGEREEASFTYGELDLRARVLAARLQELGAAADNALLLYPPGLEFISAFFGCLYAGVVAVPAYPPRLNRPQPRLRAILQDARPRFVLTTSSVLARAESLRRHVPELGGVEWLATDGLDPALAERWTEPAVGPETLAFLQYTSGSTAAPKGVEVDHGNLLHNSELIRLAFGQSQESVIVGWLPLYHDMGLIGNVLQPLYVGARCILMSPLAFLQKPVRWLRAISRYRATTSGGPNFAYDLCVQKIPPEEREGLELRSWTVAFNGAEPVQAETLERFAGAFAPQGFRREAFFPCYGLAEATLFVAGGDRAAPPVVADLDASALERNRAVRPEAGRGSRRLVSCGCSRGGQTIVIADPETGSPCPPGTVGEIWVSGPSVARGYWGKEEVSEGSFRARLRDGDGPFLRTGDLGFLDGGELFVTGRLKDLIVFRGRNIYPQDLELTAEGAHRALRAGCGAAFSVAADGGERLVLVYELERWARVAAGEVADVVRRVVAEEHETEVHEVVLTEVGSVPRTSSGKIQRGACRILYEGGELPVVGRSALRTVDLGENDEEEGTPAPHRDELLALDPKARLSVLLTYLSREAARAAGITASMVDPGRPLAALGLDSLVALELVHRFEAALEVPLSPAELLGDATLKGLAEDLLRRIEASVPGRARFHAAADSLAEAPLSWGQRALRYQERLAPMSGIYNLAAAVRIRGELDAVALACAFRLLSERHPALRTTFADTKDGSVQRVRDRMEPDIAVGSAAEWRVADLDERLHAESFRPFDLQEGPVWRVRLFVRAPADHVLLVAVHHLVSDFWSLALLFRELEVLYLQETGGEPAALLAPGPAYGKYVRWQEELLRGADGERLWAYWQGRLAGELPDLDLPADRPRPAVQTYTGGSVPLFLGAKPIHDVKALAQRHGATLFMTLLAAFNVLLHRYTGQEDLLVGTPTAGRSRGDLAGVVGYFVNPVVLRTWLADAPGFARLLARCRATALEAFEHQELPFSWMAERLSPVRSASRPPIFQAMLSLHKAEPRDGAAPAWLALGEGGEPSRWAGLALEPLRLARRPVAFDLVLAVSEIGGRLFGSLQHNADLFEDATAHRMATHFAILLERAVADPERPVRSLPLLTDAEEAQLAAWNDTGVEPPGEERIHRQIEARARLIPDAEAVVWEGQSLTYGEVESRANQVASHLLSLGVGPESLVGLCTDRSPDMVVGLLGILKAGAAYVPLDPGYPAERLAWVVEDASLSALVTQRRWVPFFRLPVATTVCLDADRPLLERRSGAVPSVASPPESLAYVIYTSGSTGRPKGGMVGHRQVANFFAGMDRVLGDGGPGTWLAVTSVSFDISVLELLWTLSRGFRVVLQPQERPARAEVREPARPLDFSLFYFASNAGGSSEGRYRLLIEGAKFADRHGFTAVWTPERHFHGFGGLYPNPAVTGAAVAAVTERVGVRAGSVVLPLHDPIRVAEEWSVVDNLSGGRAGISFASGWHADDFVFAPESYAARREVLRESFEIVRRLWRGEEVSRLGGAGREVRVRILPRPVQSEIPVWLTAAGNPETFRLAGELGARLLTHLLGQSREELAGRISVYREAWRNHGWEGEGHVTLMLHTFVGEDLDRVRETVRGPFTEYLRTSFDLMQAMAPGQDLDSLTGEEREALLARAFDRYFRTSGLFGTPETCLEMVDRMREIGVDEVACLIDFGVNEETVLSGLRLLDLLKERSRAQERVAPGTEPAETLFVSVPEQIVRHRVTHLQCTPSLGAALALDPGADDAFRRLDLLLLGGEALPVSLAERLGGLPRRGLLNMYGPTETTVWSSTHCVEPGARISIGRPIANTRLYVLDAELRPMPVGVPGELYIGGRGVVRGYWRRPGLTAERFLPDPFSSAPGERLYRTGDRVRRLPEGEIEFLGRADHQVKLRGYRIEPAEVEAVLREHPAVREAVVVVREDAADPGRPSWAADRRLVAYVVPASAGEPAREPRWAALDGHSRYRLPNGLTVAHLTAAQTSAIYNEIFEQEIYLRHGVTLSDGDCVFDVGANIGLFTLFAHRKCRNPRVFSFEPIAPTFAVLRTNVELHGLGARVLHCGLSDREEVTDFTFYPQMAGLSGRYAEEDAETTRAILSRWLKDVKGEELVIGAEEVDGVVAEYLESRRYECRLEPLSKIIREQGVERIDLLKIDVERSELQVLRGLADEDWEKVRQIVIEVHTRELLEQISPLLASRGYAVAVDEFIPVGEGLEHVYMLYAVRGGAAARPAAEPVPPLSLTKIREHLAARLPDYMCPSAFVVLDALPLTPNGKVDRRALPAPDSPQNSAERPYAEPESPEEQAVAEVWSRLLGVGRVGVDDNFFEVGGNSLLLVEAHGRLRALGWEVTLVELMRHPTIRSLTSHLRGRQVLQRAGAALPPIERSAEAGELPLSISQQRLWFLHRLEPANPAYNVPEAVRLEGPLEVEALRRGLLEIVRRHEALRTTFRMGESEAVQVVRPAPEDLGFTVVDLRRLPGEVREAELLRRLTEEARRPFDLVEGLLLRTTLLALGPEEHVFLVVMHHIVSDGWSLGVLIHELAEIYTAFREGRPSPLPELTLQYADFTRWQRRCLTGDALEAEVDLWRRRLAGAPSALHLPADRPRPAVPSGAGGARTLRLPADLVEQLSALGRRESGTLFMTLLAAFEVVLRYHSGQDDIVVGTDVANRRGEDVQKLIGFFVNQLVLRTDLSGNPSFRELLVRVRGVCLEAFGHQDLPFDRLVQALNPKRDPGHPVLFQVKVVHQNLPGAVLELPGLRLTRLRVDTGASKFELLLNLWNRPDGMDASLEYSADLFDAGTAERLLGHFDLVLRRVSADAGVGLRELESALTEADRSRKVGRQKRLQEKRRESLRNFRRPRVV